MFVAFVAHIRCKRQVPCKDTYDKRTFLAPLPRTCPAPTSRELSGGCVKLFFYIYVIRNGCVCVCLRERERVCVRLSIAVAAAAAERWWSANDGGSFFFIAQGSFTTAA